MINTFNQRLSHFRSQLHLVQEGQTLLIGIQCLKKSKISIECIDLIKKHVEEELSLAKQIRQLYIQKVYQKTNKSSMQLKVDQRNLDEEKMHKRQENIGKWNKKEYSKWSPTKSNKVSSPSPLNFFSSSLINSQLQKQTDFEANGYKTTLQQDEQQILEREIILPLNLPVFFKKKEPHRLLICHYEKCNQVIKTLKSGLNFKFDIMELEQISEWSPSKRSEIWKVIVAPFCTNSEKTIIEILSQSFNLLILYTDIQRQIQTQKLSTLEKGISLLS